MTTKDKLPLVLAFLDDVLAKDAVRTQGEWKDVISYRYLSPTHVICTDKNVLTSVILNPGGKNASFIAGSSVWSAPMARALKEAIDALTVLAATCDYPLEVAPDAIDDILSHFPDEILKPFMK